MRSYRALFVLAVIAFGTPSTTVYGQCVQFPNSERLFAHAAVVFVGIVVAHEPTGVQGFHVIRDIATFRLERSWKGSQDREVRVGSDGLFEVGKKYLVFAFGKVGEPLTTSVDCRSTELIDQANEKLDWLSKKPSQPVG